MTRNTLKQIQILPIWFNKTAILTVQKVKYYYQTKLRPEEQEKNFFRLPL